MTDNPYVYKCAVFGDYHDPIAVRRKLLTGSAGCINDWLEESRDDDVLKQADALARIVPLAREVFGLPEVDRTTGYGVTEDRVVDVVNAFTEWLEGKA